MLRHAFFVTQILVFIARRATLTTWAGWEVHVFVFLWGGKAAPLRAGLLHFASACVLFCALSRLLAKPTHKIRKQAQSAADPAATPHPRFLALVFVLKSTMMNRAQKWLLYTCFAGIAGCTCSDYCDEMQHRVDVPIVSEAQAAEPVWHKEPEPVAIEPFLVSSQQRPSYNVQNLQNSLARGGAIAAYGAKWRMGNNGLPRNVRQVQEGYWLGARPSLDELGELQARNVKIILSATHMDNAQEKALRGEIERLGMQHVSAPFGGKFPRRSKFWQTIANIEPCEIYIHCEYGGDRTGAILAFLLATRHQWSVQRAFLSVAFPGKKDSRALIDVLEKRGYEVAQSDVEQYLGIYSPENNGGFGGLKVRSRGYLKLINTTIDAIEKMNK